MLEQELIHGLRIVRLVTYFNVAATAMFLWDYILTLGMEIDYVWPSKWNLMKGMYLFQRYMPFVDTVFLGLYHDFAMLSPRKCQHLYVTLAIIMVFASAICEIILTLRTWAVWYRHRYLTVMLPVLFIAIWTPDIAFLTLFLRSLKFGERPYPGFQGCFVRQADDFLIYVWAIFMVWEFLVLVLMIIPGLRAYKYGGNTALLNVIYRDGVIYYLYLFVLSTVNIIVIKVLPPAYQQLLTTVTRCVHSMLTSRVVLHIREYTSNNRENAGWANGLSELDSSKNQTENPTTPENGRAYQASVSTVLDRASKSS